MDRTFQVAIGIILILFVVTLNLFFKASLQDGAHNVWAMLTGSPHVTVTAAPAAAPEPEAKPKQKAKRRVRTETASEPAPEAKGTEPPAAPEKVELPPPPFPSADDLKLGMTRKEMVDKFGQPRFTASWSENGMLAEKLIYARDAQVTAVILEDGHVVTSRTGPNDPWARSAWWQAGRRERAEPLDRDGAKAR